MAILHVAKAMANDRRLQILHWLKDPRTHFRRQVDGDLVRDTATSCAMTCAAC